MREIKFRAWFKRYKMMSSWEDVKEQLDLVNILTSSKYAVMQYTGLKDKNGVEIYEGDIVSCDQAQGLGFKVVGVVYFGIDYRESSGWCDPRIYLDTRPFEKNGSEFCIFHLQPEVIGNIWENPELVERRAEG